MLFDGVVCLRPFAAKDAAALATIWLDPRIGARNTVPEPSQAAASDWVQATRQRRRQVTHGSGRLSTRPPTALPAGARLRTSGGSRAARRRRAGLRPSSEGDDSRLGHFDWSPYAFARGLIRVQAHCEADNAASVRSVLAAGMRHEGTLRSYFISNAGMPTDTEVFGLVPDDLATSPALF